LDKYLGMGIRCLKLPLWQNLYAAAARTYAAKINALPRR
jgi:hypothetical protein